MRLGFAAGALLLATLSPVGAQTDPWGTAVDPWTGQPLVTDPYQSAPADPVAPVDPYQPAPLDPLDPVEPLPESEAPVPEGFETPGGAELAPFSEGAPTPAEPAPPVRVENRVAVFSGLDKITGRIVSFEVSIDETVQFGALQLTPRVCYARPPTETPKTTAFLEVDEVTLDNKYRRIFTGWMFAASPGLHAIEHPIYDVWLTECKGGTDVIAEAREQEDVPALASRQEKPRKKGQDPTRTASQVNQNGQVDVEGPRGVPVQPRQKPSRKFFPNNEGPAAAPPPPREPQSIFDALFR